MSKLPPNTKDLPDADQAPAPDGGPICTAAATARPARLRTRGAARKMPNVKAGAVDRLPLLSVRAFAVVARLLSVTRAAEELNVTPSAVSHQIRLLEEYLGTRLFRRENNTLKLTAAGQEYMAQVSEGLTLLSRATTTIRAAREQQFLRIGVTPSLASLWLIPRLPRFTRLHPEVAITLTAVTDPEPLLETAFDIAFWYGQGELPGFTVDMLGMNRIFPICKISLTRGEQALRSPADLARCTLLQTWDQTYRSRDEPLQPTWTAWLQAAGAPAVTPRRYLRLSPRVLMHQAVAAGLGVGLTSSLLAVDGLAARQIAVPFGPALPFPKGYNLVFPTHLAKRKDIAAFRDWVLEESAASVKKAESILKAHLRQ